MSEYNDQASQRDVDLSDEIDLRPIWRVLVKYKYMILAAIFGTALVAAGISLLIPNVYRAEVLLAPAQESDAKSGLSSALGNMGGLAVMAGVSLGGGGSTAESIAVLKSREFLWQFAQHNNLMPILFKDDWDAGKKRWKNDDPKKQPGQWHFYRLMVINKILDVQVEKKTEFVTVSIELKDAALAAKMANDLVAQLNQYLAKETIMRNERNLKYLYEELARTQVEEMRKMLYDIIASELKSAMMANTQKEFAFKVLDSAVEPDTKIKPKRLIIVLIAAVLAGFFAVLAVIIKEGLLSCRNEIVARRKE